MNRIKIFAMAAVAMMLLSGFTFLQDSQSSDAAEADLDIMNPGSWTWNPTTGRGPFNSFYAAFTVYPDISLYAILDPYDLSKTINGESLPDSEFNIMWVIPTVYVQTTGTSMTLSSDEEYGYPYAHHVDGHTYNYLAIGVYEASEITAFGQTYLTSSSGSTPSTNHTRAEFRQLVSNYAYDPALGSNSHAMLWNFDQWNLYRNLSFAVMEDANSQNTVGNGFVYSTDSTFKTTGLLDQAGPYAGNPGRIIDNASAASYGSDSVKLFIENAWGNVQEFVDGCVFVGRYAAYIDRSSSPTDAQSASGSTVEKIDWTTQTGFPTSIQTSNARTWSFPGATVNGSQTAGLCDYTTVATTGATSLIAGGAVSGSIVTAVQAGISNIYTNQPLSYSAANVGTRLAFVCDTLPAGERDFEYTMNFDSSKITGGSDFLSVSGREPISHVFPAEFYTVNIVAGAGGSVSETVISHIPAGDIIEQDGASFTLGGITVQATPNDPTQEFVYSFNKWNGIPAGGIVMSDLTITATFNERLQSYTVTWIIGDQAQTEQYNYGNMPRHADPTPPEGMVFDGWVPTIVTVTGDATYTAKFVTPSDTDPTHELLKLVPFFIVIAMVMAAVGTVLVKGTDPMTIVKLAIGLTIGVILLATLVIPAIGGL